LFLGIDLGTSEVKALLLSDEHQVIGATGVALDIQRPAYGHIKQNPEEWWRATVVATQSCALHFRVTTPPSAQSGSHVKYMAQFLLIKITGFFCP
jgi:sugar (pentulose or hexulose) kinase